VCSLQEVALSARAMRASESSGSAQSRLVSQRAVAPHTFFFQSTLKRQAKKISRLGTPPDCPEKFPVNPERNNMYPRRNDFEMRGRSSGRRSHRLRQTQKNDFDRDDCFF